MFTGIITAVGRVRSVDPIAAGRDMRLVIEQAWAEPPAIGASIACSGCCLTAVELGPDWFAVDASAETLAHTVLGTWEPGSRVNLERSLRVGDELGGHLVSGHVDGVGEILSRTPENTDLGGHQPGSPVNIEIDTLARYVARLAETA
jgi:riboflavin synthase